MTMVGTRWITPRKGAIMLTMLRATTRMRTTVP